MVTRLLGLIAVWCLTAFGAAAGGAGAPPPEQQPMLGEQVIVKFARGSAGQEAFAAALSGGPEAQARLGALAARLTAELRIPLRIERLTSGQEFVLAVDANGLASRLVDYLRARPDLRRVQLVQDGDLAQQRYWNPTVVAEIRAESPLGQTLAEAGADPLEHLKRFADQVSHDVGFPVGVLAHRPVELVIDVSSVATQLLARLKQRPDVAYAQRDLLMRPLRGSGVNQ